jgi:hypothetical protein
MKNIKIQLLLLLAMCAISCNDRNETSSGTTTTDGTELNDQRPHQNDGSTSGNVDTITSPGSNSVDLKTNGTDNTKSGDNGAGTTSGTAK